MIETARGNVRITVTKVSVYNARIITLASDYISKVFRWVKHTIRKVVISNLTTLSGELHSLNLTSYVRERNTESRIAREVNYMTRKTRYSKQS